LYTNLSAREGNNLLTKTVNFPCEVITMERFLFLIPFRILWATSSALIKFCSSNGVSFCALPSSLSAVFRIFEEVKPGQTHITCNPLCKFSVLKVSKKPCMANFEAEYPVLPGKPLYPAMDDTPTTTPLLFNNSDKA